MSIRFRFRTETVTSNMSSTISYVLEKTMKVGPKPSQNNAFGVSCKQYGSVILILYSQEVQVLGLLESEIFKGDIRPNLCVCPLFTPGKNKKERKKIEKHSKMIKAKILHK